MPTERRASEPFTIRRAAAGDWPRLWPIWREVEAAGDTHAYDPDAEVDAPERNVGAIALYERLGFDPVGIMPQGFRHPEHGLVGLRLMHRGLA